MNISRYSKYLYGNFSPWALYNFYLDQGLDFPFSCLCIDELFKIYEYIFSTNEI